MSYAQWRNSYFSFVHLDITLILVLGFYSGLSGSGLSNTLTRHSSGGTGKNHKASVSIASVSPDIRTKHLPNTQPAQYCERYYLGVMPCVLIFTDGSNVTYYIRRSGTNSKQPHTIIISWNVSYWLHSSSDILFQNCDFNGKPMAAVRRHNAVHCTHYAKNSTY
jgi:hypothetical protein